MTKKMKKRMHRIIIGGIVFFASIILTKILPTLNQNIELMLFLAAYFIVGGDVVKKAVQNIGHGQIFDENFLMMIATVGAFLVGEYPEGVAVMLFYQVGELFQSYAVNRSRKSIADLMDIRPDYANVYRNNEVIEVDPGEVQIAETILVKPGERVPLDGIVTKGNTSLDTMALTGESVPREVGLNDEVISGCVNITGVIEIKVTKEFKESTVSKILDLVENAASKKSESENFISKFAKYYTPIVVICAVLLAIIPPVIIGGGFESWIYRALTFLVISCPCALVISIPLSFFGGIGGAGKVGVLIKGSNYLEAMAETQIVVMDKTGTLTKGNFKVNEVYAVNGDTKELLELTAYAEYYSNHPISISLKEAYGKEIDDSKLREVEELAGHGVHAVIGEREIYVGNTRLMEQQGVVYKEVESFGTVIHVSELNKYLGYITIADEIKDDAKVAIQGLKAAGIQKIVMLTGDRQITADYVARELGITDVYAELLPGDKVDRMEELLQEKSGNGKLVFVGDGMNDAPVLARADIGIAMGGLGSDAAIEAADIVIMTDEPSKIAKAMKISKKTLRIVKQNIVFAIGIKVLVLVLAAFGLTNMWAAVFADVGVAVIAILNAMRAMKTSEL
ncbi:MAG: heavy metal translocating P-type ATPase [Lachnospiraceae bacterium]|nr:heavy metal translocating P-type ATPase [Lachnospiraceae bacterium]